MSNLRSQRRSIVLFSALFAIVFAIFLIANVGGSHDLKPRSPTYQNPNHLVPRAETPQCRTLCNARGDGGRPRKRRRSLLPLTWWTGWLQKRYKALQTVEAINEHLKEEVPKLTRDFRAYSKERDLNEKWSAIKQPLEDATNIVRVGTDALVGCSVILVVSNKEVWIGHFVEDTGFGSQDLDQAEGGVDFKNNVLSGISGPATGKYPSIKSEIQRLSPKAGTARRRPTGVEAFIITGREEEGKEMLYPEEVKVMQATIKETLQLDAVPQVHQYDVLPSEEKERSEAQKIRFEKEAIGQVLFEYDPNNGGRKSWRLLVHDQVVKERDF